MRHFSTKTYGHEVGLSCCFRQWRAESHCNQLHGYALSFKFTFGANQLDDKNWVVDFGGLKELKRRLESAFDHKTVVAIDDPLREDFRKLHELGGAYVVLMDKVGCEAFAQYAYEIAEDVISDLYADRIHVMSCECAEHGANSAVYLGV